MRYRRSHLSSTNVMISQRLEDFACSLAGKYEVYLAYYGINVPKILNFSTFRYAPIQEKTTRNSLNDTVDGTKNLISYCI